MGNAQSPQTNSRFITAARAFTQNELEDLKSLFFSLAAQSNSSGKFVSPSVFESFFGLRGPLGERLFDLVTQKRKDQKLTYEDLVVAKGTYEKGTNEEIKEFIYQLLDVSGDGALGRSDLESVLVQILTHVFSSTNNETGFDSHQDAVQIFIRAATFSENDERFTYEDFKHWCTLLPSVRKFLGSLLMPPEVGRPGCQVPRLVYGENIDSHLVLLKKEYAWHIGGALPQHELEEWRLLYHSSINGLSFTTFLGNITRTCSNDGGPTVLIVKDKEGYIYGGYASQAWERHGDFYGDLKSFLFQLYPKASIYKPTGANNNLQWCAVNFSSDSIPNGIGFGGRANHFGLFVSASFDQGHTFTCTTFGSPCLSKTNRVELEVIECWGVGGEEKGSGSHNNNGVKGSVLERFKEDRNMLKMVGLANSSE
ncbi:TLD domain-containing protein 1 isoform X1 [Cucurbita pepo subsp. pepo]|uniref:TLD domain-containing protein 1 isoform X1 n=1 Tax=Cucurbita pepo subsp. pepo TaxID=3664 RepID=UPI000C9D411B|nr:TLD domain-containing protein 1 isoform X1 [Cucurbita pepo subsp. pepo]